MKNWIRLLVAVVLVGCGSAVALAQSSPPPNPNYTQYNTKADGDIPTPPATKVRLFYNGTGFRFKTSAGTFTDVGGAGISGLTAGKLTVATSATAIANSKWTMSGTNLGTATLFDDTAVTGVTQLVITAGAGQASSPHFKIEGVAGGNRLEVRYGPPEGFGAMVLSSNDGAGNAYGLITQAAALYDYISPGGVWSLNISGVENGTWSVSGSDGHFVPAGDGTRDIGGSAHRLRDIYTSTSIQGTRSTVLTDNTITSFTTISSATENNVTAGHIDYTVVASDATTELVQTQRGSLPFLLVNENGTVTVTLGTVYGTAIDSAGGAALTNTFASSVSGTDATIRVTSDYDQATLTGTVTHTIRCRVYIDSGTATVTPIP